MNQITDKHKEIAERAFRTFCGTIPANGRIMQLEQILADAFPETVSPTPIRKSLGQIAFEYYWGTDKQWEEDICKEVWEGLAKCVADKATAELAQRYDVLVDRSVGAMAIAEGEDGWWQIRLDCPMLIEVAKLRKEVDDWSKAVESHCASSSEEIVELRARLQSANEDADRLAKVMVELTQSYPAEGKYFGSHALALHNSRKGKE